MEPRWQTFLVRSGNFLTRHLPRSLRRPVLRLVLSPVDLLERASPYRVPLPPYGSRLIGGGDFERTGEEFVSYLRDWCDLRPTSRILDVGCGIGRLAIPLTERLDEGSAYHGVDVTPQDVSWCRKQITPRFPHFRFHHIDVYNREYNWRGSTRPLEYRFEFADGSFDVVAAISLYTHLTAEVARHYLTETARLLAPGGRCLTTMFLLNHESRSLLASGGGENRFDHRREDTWVQDPSCPERATAFDETTARDFFRDAGLTVLEPIRFGNWCGRPGTTNFQDIVIAERQP